MPGLKSVKEHRPKEVRHPRARQQSQPGSPRAFASSARRGPPQVSRWSPTDPPLPLDHRRTWSEEEISSNRCALLDLRQLKANSHRGSGSGAATSNSRLSDRPMPEHPIPVAIPPNAAAPLPPDRYKGSLLCRRIQAGQRRRRRARHKPTAWRVIGRLAGILGLPGRAGPAGSFSDTCSKDWD